MHLGSWFVSWHLGVLSGPEASRMGTVGRDRVGGHSHTCQARNTWLAFVKRLVSERTVYRDAIK